MTHKALLRQLQISCLGLDAIDPLRLLVDDVIEALRENAMREVQRLGQEIEQEPVVWMYQDKSTHEVKFQKHMRGFVDHGATYETPLYTTPQQREVEHAMRLYKAVERLSLQAGEETEETIDWLCGEHGGMFKLFQAYFSPRPSQRKPLTETEIRTIRCDMAGTLDVQYVAFARAIEAAHGIKENT